MQNNVKTQEEILKEYENKSEKILSRMFQILAHAQRKVDDHAYRITLEKIDKAL
jgi:glutamate dehydrogenase/leucine dehydrogenase